MQSRRLVLTTFFITVLIGTLGLSFKVQRARAPGGQVGVKSGDWIKIDYTITGAPSGTPLPQWLKLEFLRVEGTTANVSVTMRMSDGTEQNATVPVDIVAGGQALGLSGFVISANLTTGDVIYMSGFGNLTIAGETTRTYAGASRTVVHASFSQYGTQLTYYWDKQTGVMVEASTISGSVTGTAKATETNMWQGAAQAQPSGLPIDPTVLYTLIIAAIVIVAIVAFFRVRRKKKPPERAEPEKKMTDLEQLVANDKETYEALSSTMFLDPKKVETSMKQAADNAKKSEKDGDLARAGMWYEVAGGLAIYEGDVKKVGEYYVEAERVTGRKYLILKNPQKAVAAAQEYYKKYLMA